MMSEFKVELKEFEQLSALEQAGASNNGSGRKYANYVHVMHDGRTLYLESDAMEPEDCKFTRDLGWVVSAIRAAYELGKVDARKP